MLPDSKVEENGIKAGVGVNCIVYESLESVMTSAETRDRSLFDSRYQNKRLLRIFWNNFLETRVWNGNNGIGVVK